MYPQGSMGVLPEALRPKPGHLSLSQQRVYEVDTDFFLFFSRWYLIFFSYMLFIMFRTLFGFLGKISLVRVRMLFLPVLQLHLPTLVWLVYMVQHQDNLTQATHLALETLDLKLFLVHWMRQWNLIQRCNLGC